MKDAQREHAIAKRELAQGLLRDGGFLTWVDPRAPGVDVPFRFRDLPVLVLPLGAWRAGLDSSLTIGPEGLSGAWRFGKLVWDCRVPWDAVLALAGFDGRGRTWRGELPPALKLPDPVDSVPLPDGLKYLIVNGQALVGDGWFRLELDGQQFPGVVWLEGTSSARIGGDLEALRRHFPTTVDKKGRPTAPKFNVFLGYVLGRASYEVHWLDCQFSSLDATGAQFGGHEYHWLRIGYGPGYWVWLREYFHSWKRRFTRRRSLITSSSG
jgi:hypothetical protein